MSVIPWQFKGCQGLCSWGIPVEQQKIAKGKEERLLELSWPSKGTRSGRPLSPLQHPVAKSSTFLERDTLGACIPVGLGFIQARYPRSDFLGDFPCLYFLRSKVKMFHKGENAAQRSLLLKNRISNSLLRSGGFGGFGYAFSLFIQRGYGVLMVLQ